jgi:uncharacterized repeat protein (TIGR02543 family)
LIFLHGQSGTFRRKRLSFRFRYLILLTLICAAVFLRAPLAWGTNSWNSPNMVVDTFAAGNLGTVIDSLKGVSPYTDITSLTVSGTTMTNTDFAFIRNNLSSIVMIDMSGATITALPAQAFRNDTIYAGGNLDDLQNVILPSGLTSIGDAAFYDCTGLALTSLPSGLTSIGYYAFSGCTGLALTSLPSGLTSIGYTAFDGCTGLALTSLPSGLTSIGSSAFRGCTGLALTSLPSGLTSIGNYAFQGCTGLALTSLPSGLTSIGDYAFQSCMSLATVVMPQSLPTIGTDAFANTSSNLVFLVPGHSSYASWMPPVGTKIVTVDGSITLSGSNAVPTEGSISLSSTQITGAAYQWQKEITPGTWTNIDGATGSTYSKSGAAAADSGSYRARITFGSVTPFHTAAISVTVTSGTVYTVAFNSQGGSAVPSMTAAPGTTIAPPAVPVRPGYSFGGWYKEAACVNVWDFAADTVAANITLYAKWQPAAATPTAVTATVGGVSYGALLQGDGAWHFDFPAGTNLSAVTFSFTLPAGASVSPSGTAAYDFTGGSLTFTVTAADGVTQGTALLRAVTLPAPGTLPGSVESIEISGFPLTLGPGKSFDVTLAYGASDPEPVLSVNLDRASAALVTVEILSSGSARVTALPQDAPINSGAPSNSAVYGEALINFTATQTISGTVYQKSAICPLVIADDLFTSVNVTDPVREEFNNANMELVSSDEYIMPGNAQPPITALNPDWFLIEGLDNARIAIEHPVPEVLPECFEPAGKDAADIDIDVSGLVPPGKKGLLPLTFRVTARSADLTAIFGASLADAILSSPLSHLDTIFSKMLIQKEILEGERKGWYTRLVDGVLKPRDAVDKGILEITGGGALTLSLSYYVLDDSVLEAFEQGGYPDRA